MGTPDQESIYRDSIRDVGGSKEIGYNTGVPGKYGGLGHPTHNIKP
jgi:hypothetical protein